MSRELTRRELLRTGVLAALGAGLASCTGPQRLSDLLSPEPTATPAPTSTVTPSPTATALPSAAALPSATAIPSPTRRPTLAVKEPPTPIAGGTPPPELQEALYYLRGNGDFVQCQMCWRQCAVGEGERGFCRNKVNLGGQYYTLVYGRPSALQIDPVEKEPHFHMLPGGTIFCTGTASCNNRCKFCHNWHLSQRSFEEIEHVEMSPAQTVALAREMGCNAVSFTYNEPTVFYEHMYDTTRLAKRAGLGTLFHTNGGINEKPLAALLEYMDAVTVDLKAFIPEFYREVSTSRLEPVLRALKQIHQSEAHLEIVNLMVPTLNDDMEDVRRMCRWICDTLSEEVPLHFTRFHPAYKLTSLPPTPLGTLEGAAQIADEEGLHYVYVGNYPGHHRNSTYCPACGKMIIGRVHFSVMSLDVVEGQCRFCEHPVPGVWWDT